MQENYSVALTGFTLNDGKTMPEEFEVYITVDNKGGLSAACWDEGTFYTDKGEPGAFSQARMSSYWLKDVKAWLPIEKYSYDELHGKLPAENELNFTIDSFVVNDGKNRPEAYGEYLLIWKDGQLSAGCWLENYYPDTKSERGVFKQSRGGLLDLECIKAWALLD